VELVFNPNIDLVEAIANTKELYELHLGRPYNPNEKWHAQTNTDYWVFLDKVQIYGMASLSKLTDKMLDSHFYLLPQYWGTGKSIEAAELVMDHLKNHTEFNVLLTVCPDSAIHAQTLVSRLGFHKSGVFPKALTYFNKQEDLHQYFYNLRG
jgi:RimJ/RimL family protein N-acetyltransferase